jgi:phosphoribosylformylglycinamidine synthase
MAFGNGFGVRVGEAVSDDVFFGPGWGSIVAEVPAGREDELAASAGGLASVIGNVTDDAVLSYKDAAIPVEDAWEAAAAPLDGVFRAEAAHKHGQGHGHGQCGHGMTDLHCPKDVPLYEAKDIAVCTHKLGQPTVFIPAFPGTNCEIDSARAMERAGAATHIQVMRNLTAEDIRSSVEDFAKGIAKAQIVMFPGGFSAGDEPDGSAKFFATMFRNARIKEEI